MSCRHVVLCAGAGVSRMTCVECSRAVVLDCLCVRACCFSSRPDSVTSALASLYIKTVWLLFFVKEKSWFSLDGTERRLHYKNTDRRKSKLGGPTHLAGTSWWGVSCTTLTLYVTHRSGRWSLEQNVEGPQTGQDHLQEIISYADLKSLIFINWIIYCWLCESLIWLH